MFFAVKLTKKLEVKIYTKISGVVGMKWLENVFDTSMCQVISEVKRIKALQSPGRPGRAGRRSRPRGTRGWVSLQSSQGL